MFKALTAPAIALSVALVAPLTGGALSPAKAAEIELRALVLDVTGPTVPELLPFDEIPAGAVVRLDPETELSLTFYPTCEDVTVKGGTVRFVEERITVEDDGQVLAYGQSACPATVELVESDVINAAIITRSAAFGQSRIALQPVIALTGKEAALYDRVAVHDRSGEVAAMTISGRRATWPAEAPSLSAGQQYLVVLTGPSAQMMTAKVTAAGDAPGMTLIRR